MYICMRVFVSACAQSFCQRRSQLDASVTVDMSQDIRAGHFSSPALPPALHTSISLLNFFLFIEPNLFSICHFEIFQTLLFDLAPKHSVQLHWPPPEKLTRIESNISVGCSRHWKASFGHIALWLTSNTNWQGKWTGGRFDTTRRLMQGSQMPQARLNWWFPHLGEFFWILVPESADEDTWMIAKRKCIIVVWKTAWGGEI